MKDNDYALTRNNSYVYSDTYVSNEHHWYGHVSDARNVNLGDYILLGLFLVFGIPILIGLIGTGIGSGLLGLWAILKVKEWIQGERDRQRIARSYIA